MSITVLAETERRAAHGLHRCGYCGQNIAAREQYLDQRNCDNGTVWTFRSHLGCGPRYWRAHRALGLHDDDYMHWSDVLDWEDGDPK